MGGHVSTNGNREFDLIDHKVIFYYGKTIMINLYGLDANDVVVASLTVEDAVKLRDKINTALQEAESK